MKDSLYQLIHSLSQSEKRYFKLISNKTGVRNSKKYVSIFDILVNQSEYNESEVIAKLKKNKFETKYFSADKSYLFQLILGSLKQVHTSKKNKLVVLGLLEEVEILYEKNLIKLAQSRLKKAKKIAIKNEMFALNIEVLRIERKLNGTPLDLEILERQHSAYIHRIEQLLEFNDYDFLYRKTNIVRKNIRKTRTDEVSKNFEKFLSYERMSNKQEPISFFSQFRKLQIQAGCYYSLDQTEKEFNCIKNLVGLMDKRPGFPEDYPAEYVPVVSRYLVLLKNKSPDQYQLLLKKFKKFPSKLKNRKKIEANVFALAHGMELNRMIDNGEFINANKEIQIVRDGMFKYKQNIDDTFLLAMHYRFAYVFVALEMYVEALDELNYLIDNFQETVRPDIYSFSKILLSIAHLELGNVYLVPFLLKSVQVHFRKRQKLYAAEAVVLKFLKKINRQKDKEQLRLEFINFKNELLLIFKNPYERKVLAYFDFITWANSKIENRSFMAIKKQTL